MTNTMFQDSFSPYEEILSYETLWARQGATLKRVSEYLKDTDRPSKVQMNLEDMQIKTKITNFFSNLKKDFSIITAESYQYPNKLREPKHQIKLLYYKGDLGLLDAPKRISIVGARKASKEGIARAVNLTRGLIQRDYVIVSGLAEGIDTAALTTAVKEGGNVVGVIGTPINQYYPRKNADLQDVISNEHLLISHVPIYRYSVENFNTKRFYFPQRNITMAAVSDATVIVEASDTSGTLTQARACLELGRKLFILNSCFENKDITWPKKYEARGAIRVNTMNDVFDNL